MRISGKCPKYEVIIYSSEEDKAFVAEVPELPGCAADGKTYRDTLANLEAVINVSEFGLGFNAQASCIVRQRADALVGNLTVP